jgi:hypothetical protein
MLNGCAVRCRARNAAMTQWRAGGGGGPTPRAGDPRSYLQRASLTAFDRDEEREHDKDQVRRPRKCPKP